MDNFFLLGLRERLMEEVTLSGATTMEEMISVIQRVETSEQQKCDGHSHAIASASASTESSSSILENQIASIAKSLEQLQSSAPFQGQVATSSAPRGRFKSKGRNKADVKCYFCLKIGHYASECARRKAERAEGKYRPTIHDQPISKEAYDQLSREERTKGSNVSFASTSTISDVPSLPLPKVVQTQEQLYSDYFKSPSGN